MTLSADVTYRNIRSRGLDAEIRKRLASLRTFCPDIQSCKVVVEVPHRHHQHGNHVHVRIDMAVPGETIVAGYDPSPRADEGREAPNRVKRNEIAAATKDAALAVRHAFATAKRQLQDYVRRRRGAVKNHENGQRARRVGDRFAAQVI